MDKQKIAKQLRKISREQQLEQEAQFGRLRAKSWDERPSRRQERRKTKLDLKRMAERNDYEGN